jgi:L-ascorbate metabolism protein UlaG (beta-lactamase superfamily)
VFAHPTPGTWSDENLTAAWIGHSTVLTNFFGVSILTDPVLFPRIGIRLPFLTVGPKRLTEPALTFAQLPPIDLVLLSHAHFDHIDRRTLKLFPESTRVITARRTRDLLRGTNFCEVIELDWNESVLLTLRGRALEIRAFRPKHWGARLQYDVHRGYNSYVISRENRRIIYGSDTAMTDAFAKLNDGLPYDLAIMGIGAMAMATAGTDGLLFAGRFAVGMGATVTFIGTLKLAATWFHVSHFGTMAAITANADNGTSTTMTPSNARMTIRGIHTRMGAAITV